MIKKVLIKKTRFAFSAVPSIEHLAPNAGVVIEGRRKSSVPSNIFSDFFGKSIDGAKRECSLEHLSPKKGAVL